MIDGKIFREFLENYIKKNITDENIAIALSGGMDSNAVLFGLLELGKKVTVYSFRMDGVESSDFIKAKETAKVFSLPFKEVILPRNIDILYNDLTTLKDLGAKGKTDFECFWPFYYLYKQIISDGFTNLCTGLGSDQHFCLSKKGMIHYKDKIDDFRNILYNKPTYSQHHMHTKFCSENNIKNHLLYFEQDLKNMFLGTTWDEVNKPKQKNCLRTAYPNYMEKVGKIKEHTNLQLGDSGIAEFMSELVNSKYNTTNAKSPLSIYNRITKSNIKNKLTTLTI